MFTFTAPDGTTAVTYPSGPATRIGLAERVHGLDEACPRPEPDDQDPGPTPEGHERWFREQVAKAEAWGWNDPDDPYAAAA